MSAGQSLEVRHKAVSGRTLMRLASAIQSSIVETAFLYTTLRRDMKLHDAPENRYGSMADCVRKVKMGRTGTNNQIRWANRFGRRNGDEYSY